MYASIITECDTHTPFNKQPRILHRYKGNVENVILFKCNTIFLFFVKKITSKVFFLFTPCSSRLDILKSAWFAMCFLDGPCCVIFLHSTSIQLQIALFIKTNQFIISFICVWFYLQKYYFFLPLPQSTFSLFSSSGPQIACTTLHHHFSCCSKQVLTANDTPVRSAVYMDYVRTNFYDNKKLIRKFNEVNNNIVEPLGHNNLKTYLIN